MGNWWGIEIAKEREPGSREKSPRLPNFASEDEEYKTSGSYQQYSQGEFCHSHLCAASPSSIAPSYSS
jgi:hypothetical protein